MWEDDANKMGGRWLISLEKKQRNSDLDRFWLDVVSQYLSYCLLIHYIRNMYTHTPTMLLLQLQFTKDTN